MFSLARKEDLPTAHILMAMYNSERFITTALGSVFKQDYQKIKLIIMNDGSTDGTMFSLDEYIRLHPEVREKIHIEGIKENQGVAMTRKLLLRRSKALDPQAYIFWLDSDDIYSETNAISTVICKMLLTKADICVFNFSVDFEDASAMSNAAGLLRDRENHQKILQTIHSSPKNSVSPLEIDIMGITSLGWTKCYAPSVQLPEPANCPFEDFVYMAALLNVKVITAIDPSRQLMQYLRRSTSICGQRTAENFTIHIPTQISRFFDAVLDLSRNDDKQIEKIKTAEKFVRYKLSQYEQTLTGIVSSRTREDIQESVLVAYKNSAEKIIVEIQNALLAIPNSSSGYTDCGLRRGLLK